MPRDPRQIQLEIDSARESLAATLDQIAFRTSPTRLKTKGKDAVQRFLQTPAGQATVGAVGLLVTFVVVVWVGRQAAARISGSTTVSRISSA